MKNSYPKISIITPSLNQGAFIEKTISSVIEQKYPNLEYIIIDGGSVDNTIEVIKKYEKHITFWISETDSGQTNAINKGIKKASGEIIAWLNSDDYYYPGALQTISEMYLTNPNAGLYIGNGSLVDKNGTRIRKYSKDIVFDYATLLKGSNFILQPSSFINAEVISKIGLLDESLHFAMDLEYWLRISKDYQVMTVNEELSAYRWYDDIKTRTGGIKRWVEQWAIINKYSNLQITPGLLVEFFNVLQEKEVSDHLGTDISEFSKIAWLHFYKIMQNLLDTDDCIPLKGTGEKYLKSVNNKSISTKDQNNKQESRSTACIKSIGSKMKIDVVLPEGHSWFVREGYVNALKHFGVFNRSFYVSPDKSNSELYEYLRNPNSDLIFLLNTDWHAQYLHDNIQWKTRWSENKLNKILFSFECMNNPVAMKNETWRKDTITAVNNAMSSINAVVFAHEIDDEFFEKYDVPIKWQPFAIDEELFPSPKKFSERYSKAYFRGKTTPFYYENTYLNRRRLIKALQGCMYVDLFDSYNYSRGSTKLRAMEFIAEMNKYQITLSLPSLSPTLVVRPFEAMASGCVAIQNHIRGGKSRVIFEHNKNTLFYDENNTDELINHINYCLKNPDFAMNIAQEGYNEVLLKHTIKHRVSEILKWINNGFDSGEEEINKKVIQKNINTKNRVGRKDKIIIDGVIFQLQKDRPAGISRVWASILKELSDSDFTGKVLLLDRRGTCPSFPNIEKRTIELYDQKYYEADPLYLQDICDEENADLFISTYYTYPENTHCIIMLHDMIPELFHLDKEYCEWQAKTNAIFKANAFLSVSKSTMNDFRRIYPQYSDKEIFLVPNAVSEIFKPQEQDSIDKFKSEMKITKPYYVFMGHRANYKNAQLLLKAFSQLSDKEQYEILFTGGNELLEDELKPFAGNLNCRIEFIKDSDIPIALSGAIALVYPSKYEGFGLPVLEAMKSGCPVITCRNSSLTEVAGDAALVVDEEDVNEMAKALVNIRTENLREYYIKRGLKRASQYSWSLSFEKFISAISNIRESLYGKPLNESDPVHCPDRLFYLHNKKESCSQILNALSNLKKLLVSGKEIPNCRFLVEERVLAQNIGEELFARLIEMAENGPQKAMACYLAGIISDSKDEFERAFYYYKSAFINKMEHWRIGYLVACAAMRCGAYQEARMIFEKLLKENPDMDGLKDNLEKLNKLTSGLSGEILLTAIVSTYNSELFFEECLNDLVRQTIFKSGEMEIIVVDSSSQQNEGEIVKEFQKKYNNIKYIRTKYRESIYQAWNRGIKASQGKYLTNANTDDRHKSDALKRMVNILESDSNIDIVYANDLQTNISNDNFHSKTSKLPLKWSEFDKDLLLFGCFIGPHPVWKRSLHEEFGYFDESLKVVGDYEFWLRISERARFFHLDEILGLYYYSEQSAEHRNQTLTDFEHSLVQQRYLIKYLNSDLDIRRIQMKLEQLGTKISNKKYLEEANKLIVHRLNGITLQEQIQEFSKNESLFEDTMFLTIVDGFIKAVDGKDVIIDKAAFLGILNSLKAVFFLTIQDIEAARDYFIKSLMDDPQNQTSLKGLQNFFGKRIDLFVNCMLNISEELFNQQKLDKAKIILERVLEYDFNNPDALNNLAAIEIMNNNIELATGIIERTLAAEPSNEIALNNLNYIKQLFTEE